MIPLKDENPTETFPLITISLIVLNCLFFFIYNMRLSLPAMEMLVMQAGMIPHRVTHEAGVPAYATFVTSMFLHGNFLHLAGNMLYLWIFGNNIEDRMGWIRFIIFYFLCGLGASFAHIISNPDSVKPAIGASGAISGVLGSYLLLYPRAKVLVVIPIIFLIEFFWLPAYFVLSWWFALQVVAHTLLREIGGIAWSAHIGGFVVGLILTPLFAKRRKRGSIVRGYFS